MLGRMTRDLPGFLRRPLSLGEAGAGIRRRLDVRERGFLDLLELDGVQPRSPYARPLAVAGCEPGRRAGAGVVRGIGGRPGAACRPGVYVDFDELKGAARGDQRQPAAPLRDWEFDNPLVTPHFVNLTGGTRGRPSRVLRSLAGFDGLAAFLG